jgi:hypothetical protein
MTTGAFLAPVATSWRPQRLAGEVRALPRHAAQRPGEIRATTPPPADARRTCSRSMLGARSDKSLSYRADAGAHY